MIARDHMRMRFDAMRHDDSRMDSMRTLIALYLSCG
jgi:hypothetical protein